MTPKETDFKREHELFRLELSNMVDHRHALVKLSHQIDWEAFASWHFIEMPALRLKKKTMGEAHAS
jgi:hypothetical protein